MDQQLIYIIVQGLFTVARWLIFARIIISFLQVVVRIDPYNAAVRFIYEITEPVMAPFRRLIPPIGGMDFSPIVLFLVLQFLERIVYQLVGMLLG
ncbi:MAG: YggT family protein [Thermincola sp.]|nr:YggT family protein [Thermincola sp.]MDT3704069.1 YggT family protein [Thermincola sp.]